MKMFSRLFSRKQSKDSVSDALEQLRNTENILLKKQAFLEAKAMAVSHSNFVLAYFLLFQQFELARNYGTKKKKEGMEALRAKKKYEAELQRVNGTIITIQNQISNLEDAFVNAEMLKAMGNASKALKTTYDGMDADAVMLPSFLRISYCASFLFQVHDLVDEIDEQREMVDEIATALSTQYGASVVVDEDDLLAELNSLEKVWFVD